MSKKAPLGEPNGSSDANGKESSVECPTCGRDDFVKRGDMKIHHNAKHGESLAGVDVECAWCGEIKNVPPSTAENHPRHFCNKQCHANWDSEYNSGDNSVQSDQIKIYCDRCGGVDYKTPSKYEGSDNHFCSRVCNIRYQVENADRHWNEVEKIEIECTWCGEPDVYTPNQASKSERHFCDRNCYGNFVSENWVGENHFNWEGGYEKDYGKNWLSQRRKALERDQYRCQACGATPIDLGQDPDVHHLKKLEWYKSRYNAPEWWERGNDVDNLVSLCRSCHQSWEGIPLRPQLLSD